MSTPSTLTHSKRKGNGAGAQADLLARARPNFHQHAHEIQPYGTVLRYPIALDEKIRVESVAILNQVLVDTMTLRDLYMAADVAELTLIPRAPRGREQVPVQISRLLEAHEMLLLQLRRGADKTAELGDQGTNDLLVSQVLRTNEMQVWFLSEHLVDAPLAHAE